MKEGKLVPMVIVYLKNDFQINLCVFIQEVVLDLLKENMIKNADKSKGFLIDGYPREVPQAKKFEELVCKPSLADFIFNIDFNLDCSM